jgi:hypothetical protein
MSGYWFLVGEGGYIAPEDERYFVEEEDDFVCYECDEECVCELDDSDEDFQVAEDIRLEESLFGDC